jgi:hypothetical protein
MSICLRSVHFELSQVARGHIKEGPTATQQAILKTNSMSAPRSRVAPLAFLNCFPVPSPRNFEGLASFPDVRFDDEVAWCPELDLTDFEPFGPDSAEERRDRKGCRRCGTPPVARGPVQEARK